VRIFKKKRRKTYRKTIGHRQHFTQIQINSLG
jgi:ribosomal protein L21